MFNSISMPEFEQKWKREDLDLVDVRELNEWERGHVKGAKHLPLSNLSEAKNELDKDKHYYVMCHSGARSSKACKLLSEDGYQVTNVMGGFSAWRGDVV